MVGVSTRAVRHYHHQGLLPEPRRRANGYRHYGLRDAIVLARIRRLTELGLSLDEVRDALADDGNRELREILVDLDRKLAEQEQRIRDRRARLIERAEHGELDADSTVSPGTAELLATLNTTDLASPMGALERDLFALMDTTRGEPRDQALAAVLRRRRRRPVRRAGVAAPDHGRGSPDPR